MHKHDIYLLMIAILGILTGCNNLNYRDTYIPSLEYYGLEVSQTYFDFYTSEAVSESFEVYSENTSWRFTSLPEWISLNPNKGNDSQTIEMSLTENTSADGNRTGLFTLNSDSDDWKYSIGMSVTQAMARSYLEVEETYVDFGGLSGSESVNINTNSHWEVSCNQSWVILSADNDDNVLTISVEANPSNSYRQATVNIVNANNDKAYIQITQSPSDVISSESRLNFECTASKYIIEIESEIDWTTEVSDDWIKVTPESGKTGKSKMTIEVTPNSSTTNRTGYVTIMAGDYKKLQLSLYQEGIYIRSVNSLKFDARESSKELTVSSNTDWKVISVPDWVSVNPESGNGDAEVKISVTANESISARDGYIILGQDGIDIECKISIEQAGQNLKVDNSYLSFSADASEQHLSIISECSWTSTVDSEWINISVDSGNGDADVTVSVDENNSGEERIGGITYNWLDNKTHVNVHQLSRYASVDKDAFTFDSKGGTHTIYLATDDSWKAEIMNDVDWMTISQNEGSGDSEIVLKVEDNPSINIRSTTIIISTESAQDFKIEVTQKPRYMLISTQNILFFGKGGMSDIVRIETDGEYTVSTQDSWLTINSQGEQGFSVFAAPNTSGAFRIGYVTITMTDLVDCSYSIDIPVVQIVEGGSFIVNGYPEDYDWDYIDPNQITIKIEGYSSDKNWGDNFGHKLIFNISGFSDEQDWNPKNKLDYNFNNTNFGGDKNWD